MRLLENLPIKRKLMLIGLVTNGVAVILLSVLFGAGEWTSYRDRAVTTLSVHAGITADNAASALIFADEKAAQEVLARLSAETNIVYAALQEKSGDIVAKFEIPGRKKIPVTILASDEHLFFLDQLVYAKNVVYSGETVGILYLQSDLRGVYWELFKKLLLIAVTMMFSLAFAVFLFARFQKSISDPILNMAEAMRDVITEQNFMARVASHGQDELGMLAGTFNIMLEYIQLRDAELAQYREHLEEEVAQRTTRLTEAQRIAHLGNWEWNIVSSALIWSDEVYRIFGLAPQQFGVDYKAFLQAVHPEDRQFVDAQVRAALERRHPYSIDHRIVRPGGTVRYVHEQAEVLCNEEGQPVRMLGTVQDITERKQAEEELRRSNTDLEQFAYAASHDMRQPLRMISSYLQLLESDLAPVLTDETRQNLQFATEGAKRMDQMLMALLDYSRIGRKADVMAVIDSREVMDEALHFLEPSIEEAQAEVRINGVWPHLFASRDEILRLFQNLIDNALKYRLAGQKPEVVVSAQTVGGEWRLEVRDNGVGLLPGHEARLFKVFERLQSRSRYPGTGIGLALCRKIVEHHKGRIWAESPGKDQGCTFIVMLPASVVLLDLSLPDSNGLDTVRAMRAALHDVPIVILTGHDNSVLDDAALKVGAQDYLVKGQFERNTLGRAVRHALVRGALEQELERKSQELLALHENNMDDMAVASNILSHIMRSDGLRDPQIRYFQRPTQQFGGDFIAAARDNRGDLRIILADVTGHGLQAALFLLPIFRVFHTMVKKGLPTCDIVAELNQTMREIAVPGRFIAAAVAHIARERSSIEIWNGGIPTAAHLQKNGEMHKFCSRHLPLGILDADAFEADTEIFHAPPGMLLLSSDGLIEAENASGEPFGEARFETLLRTSPPDKLFDNILSALENHIGGGIAHDDVSMVLAQCGV